MYSTLKPLYPSGQANRTDPIVRHDSSLQSGTVVKSYTPQNNLEDPSGTQGVAVDTTKQDGIYVPIVKLNNYVLDMNEIMWMKLYYDKFTPYLDITVYDGYGTIQCRDVPGLDNVITVVITSPVDGIYKKISLDFYITNVRFNGQTITYSAELKLLPLESSPFMQMKFCVPGGCNSKECNLPENTHPTTYEFLHECASYCGLGFAATQQTKEIKDDRYRILSSEKMKNVIQKHTAFGGTSNESIFDSWVDIFGYLTLVNVPWILNEEVAPNELAIVAMNNMDATSNDTTTAKESGYVHRLITNANIMPSENNLMIKSWDNIVNTAANLNNGTDNTYNIFKPLGNDTIEGNNSIDSLKIQEIEASVDGINNKDNYMFQNVCYAGTEMNELNGTIKQKFEHDRFFDKIRSRKLKVTLLKPNLGIERGTLISVLIFEYSLPNKKAISSNYTSMFGDKSTKDPNEIPLSDLMNPKLGFINTTNSGIYYVDGMDFEYSSVDQRIYQSLYLIKKGNLTNLNYNSVPGKVS